MHTSLSFVSGTSKIRMCPNHLRKKITCAQLKAACSAILSPDSSSRDRFHSTFHSVAICRASKAGVVNCQGEMGASGGFQGRAVWFLNSFNSMEAQAEYLGFSQQFAECSLLLQGTEPSLEDTILQIGDGQNLSEKRMGWRQKWNFQGWAPKLWGQGGKQGGGWASRVLREGRIRFADIFPDSSLTRPADPASISCTHIWCL